MHSLADADDDICQLPSVVDVVLAMGQLVISLF